MSTPPATLVVGFIGLGDQGLPMAAAIADAGMPLHVWARRPEALEDVGFPFTRSESVEELAAAVDVLAVCVSTDEVVLGLAERAIPAMRRGAVFVNHGTGTPATAHALGRVGAEHGVHVLDAPVSGGRPAAEAKTLTTLVGGDDTAYRLVESVFETFSAHVLHLGAAGSGQQAKLFNNALMLLNQHAIADVLAVAAETGTDVPSLVDALRLGSAGSRSLDLLGTMITQDTADHLSEVCLLDVDMFAEAMRVRREDGDAMSPMTERIVSDAADGARRLRESVDRLS